MGLAVQGRPRANEVRNVGDVDAQPPMPVVELFQRDGVVVVAGVHGINRDDRLARQVEALADRLVEAVGLLPGLVQGVLGELFGQAELADDGERIDARLALRPQDLDDHALAFMDGRGEADHLDDHLVVGPGILRAGVADEDRLGEELAIDLHEGRSLRLEVRPDELAGLPLDDLHDSPAQAQSSAGFLGAGPFDVLDFDGHHVAAGRIERVFGRDEDVVRSRVVFCLPAAILAGGRQGADEAEALLRAMEDADDPRAGVFGALALPRRFGREVGGANAPLSFRERGGGRGMYLDAARPHDMIRGVAHQPLPGQSFDRATDIGGFLFRQAEPLGDYPWLDGLIVWPVDEIDDRGLEFGGGHSVSRLPPPLIGGS